MSDSPVPGNDSEEMDTRVGHYRLLERLGEGGCGIVYLAEQMEPVRRRVALKIIRLGMDTENVIARFEMERQALAMMDHPNIARVYDAGSTSSGRPFFVMQWVEGKKITDFCDGKQLGIRQRLELFSRVCLAIQHAHQKGVIHRDIKPSNIIVMETDGVAVPKVIDFGVAKATTGTPGDDSTFTEAGQFIGTPAYMSPEQAGLNGMDVDTRCDIYALGTLLYELLTGRPPFDPKKYGNIAAADKLLAEIPSLAAQPSLESASTFRFLGDWHVAAGRWQQAAARYSALVSAITAVDASDTDDVSRDLLPAAAALCETGNSPGYQQLRKIAIQRFQHTKNPVVAEQLLKTCLLFPADAKMLAALDPCRALAELHAQENSILDAWRAFAVALMHFRRGDDTEAAEWVERSLASSLKNQAMETSARMLRAMVWYRQGKTDESRTELTAACEIQGDRFTGQLQAHDASGGYWFDWVNSRILRREAESMIVR